jgi:hypothetical protein
VAHRLRVRVQADERSVTTLADVREARARADAAREVSVDAERRSARVQADVRSAAFPEAA